MYIGGKACLLLILLKKGNAVLISEEDFNAMQETLFLCSTPSMQDKLLAGMNTPLEECEEWIDGEE
jgi:PHD/YefM family antitoxin component YafN of YafNO toxin-antitoxin module